MKKTFQIVVCIIFIVSIETSSQNLIKVFEGIPIMTGLPDWDWTQSNLVHIDSMRKAGIDFVNIQVDNNTQMDALTNLGLKVIPNKSKGLNYIQYYTDAKYTVWETEDTPEDTSYLQHHSNVMFEESSGDTTYIKLRSEAANNVDTLVWGPYYSQYVYELDPNNTQVLADYTAEFNMKLELNIAYPDTVTPENMNDTICIIQVTQSAISTSPDWHLACTYVIQDSIIPRWKFLSLNRFQDFNLIYTLDSNACQETPPSIPPPQHHIAAYSGNPIEDIDLLGLIQRHYIQFKVIWLGNPRYLISIDKITVHDGKGFQLIKNDTTFTKILIESQLNTLSPSYDNQVAGWFGIDEPNSIDNYHPIKRVIEILNNYSNNTRPLWLALMGKWDGVFNHRNDKFGTYHLSPWNEMKKRIGNMNVWQDAYYLDYPYRYNYGGSDTACNCTDYRVENIAITAELNYKQAHDISTDYGVSIQCGEIHIPGIAEQRNIYGHELLYETNLALLEGAKFLTLYTYFAQLNVDNDTTAGTTHGIVDFINDTPTYTGKYDTLRYIIKPQLNGFFGKTIKTLVPDTQFVAWNAINAVDSPYVNYPAGVVKKIEPRYGADGDERCFIELGFFHKPDEDNKRYFMPLNRYYSNIENLKFTLKNLYTYKNWNLVDYIDNRTTYLAADANLEAIFYDTIPRGDARLYSIAPTIIYGGTLTADEILKNSVTLQNDLIVNPGVTLTINNSLTSYGDIRLKEGSKLRTTNHSIGGTITFLQGKKLIIEGEVEISGLPDKKLTIDFTSRVNDNGIRVYDGNKLTIKNTLLKNAYKGIFVDGGELYFDSSEVIGCNRGLYLNNTNYQIDIHEGTKVWNSTFHENHCGMAFLESSAMVVGNDISNNRDYGVMCLENSSPVFGELLEPGLNRFGNTINLYSSYSFPVVGIDDREYIAGYNNFEGREVDWHIIAIEKSTVMAENNLWASGEPDPRKFYADESSTIDIIPFLKRSPFEFICPQVNNNLITSNSGQGLESTLPMNDYMRALKYFYTGDKKNCRVLLKNILQNYPDSIIAFASLNLLQRTYNSTAAIDSLKIYLQQFTTTTSQSDIVVYGKLLMAELDKTNYLTKLSNLLNAYSNSSLKDFIYFKKFKYYLFDQSSPDSARIISNQMLSLFPESQLVQETKFLLGDDVLQKSNTKSGTLPLSYFLGNYPNPFNPVTTIKYSLPQAEKVNITVYDVLGSEVKALVNDEKEAGNYEIIFNASNLSSGCYFYRIVTKDFVKTMKMLMLK